MRLACGGCQTNMAEVVTVTEEGRGPRRGFWRTNTPGHGKGWLALQQG